MSYVNRIAKAILLATCVTVTCLCLTRIGNGQSETPDLTYLYNYVPQSDVLANPSHFMTDELVDQGYTLLERKDTDTSDDDPADCSAVGLKYIIDHGHNFIITSHGGNVMECYGETHEAARDQSYNQLIAAGWDNTCISKATSGGAYNDLRHVIVYTQKGAATWSIYKKQIIFLCGCATWNFMDDFDGGLILGYYGSPDPWPGGFEQDAKQLFKNMNGTRSSGTKRRSGDALALGGYSTNFRHSGSIHDDMVLAPAVKDYFPKSSACANCKGWVEFDCKMKNTTAANVVYGLYCVYADNVAWVNDHKVEFDITSANPGELGRIYVNPWSALSANNSVRLDGDSIAPNGDSHDHMVNCTVGACDPTFVQTDQRRPEEVARLRQERREH